jgi:putative oxidoreductase
MKLFEYIGWPLGRLALSFIFVYSGIIKIFTRSSTCQMIAAHGFHPALLFYVVAVLIELGAGLSVLLGYRAGWGAFILLVYLIIITPVFHNFWDFHGMMQIIQMINFYKNISIIGGLLLVASRGSGPVSMDQIL